MKKLSVFFGHHKCATKFVRNICDDLATLQDWSIYNFADEGMISGTLGDEVSNRNLDFLMYTNARPQRISELPEFKGFHIVRDPRDIIVSSYFSHAFSHSKQGRDPAFEDHREKLRKVELEEGIFMELEYRKEQMEDMYNWDYNNPAIYETKLENVMSGPYNEFIKIFNHLTLLDNSNDGLERLKIKQLTKVLAKLLLEKFGFGGNNGGNGASNMSPNQLFQILYNNRYEKKTKGRKQGQEDKNSHYRKGISGDWKNYFTPEHVDFFKKNYNDLLLKLNYEENPDWNL